MMRILIDALRAGCVTEPLPPAGGGFAGAHFGRPTLTDVAALAAAIDVCPAQAITVERAPDAAVVDEGRCVFCGLCTEGVAAAFANEPVEPAVAHARADLRRRFPLQQLPISLTDCGPDHSADDAGRLTREAEALSSVVKARFRRSAHIRHLSAGGCNGCEWELNQLQAPTYDLQRFGLDFVASPRHADILLVTGVVTRNLEMALVRTLDAMARPRLVLAVGACAISGGVFATSYASAGGVDRLVAVDAYVAGCPPRPWAVLRGLRLLLQ